MSDPRTVGDTSPVSPKTCPKCGHQGEWPKQPCPVCRGVQSDDDVAPALALGYHDDPLPHMTGEVVTGRVVVSDTQRLRQLANDVNDAHRAVQRKGVELIEAAIVCGQALLEARGRVKSDWLGWMESELDMHVTTAYRYMRLAEYAKEVRAAHVTSINAAMGAIADQPRRGQGPRAYTASDKADWLKLVDQVGMNRAATVLGVSVSTVWKWTAKTSPDRGRETSKLDRPAPLSDEMVERVAGWLVRRFADADYFARVNEQVRSDARELLYTAFGERPR